MTYRGSIGVSRRYSYLALVNPNSMVLVDIDLVTRVNLYLVTLIILDLTVPVNLDLVTLLSLVLIGFINPRIVEPPD